MSKAESKLPVDPLTGKKRNPEMKSLKAGSDPSALTNIRIHQ
jgi:hypothetical protein